MDMQSLAVFFMVAVAFGGVAWVFIYPLLSGERHAERRKETVARTGAVAQARSARNAQKTRREQVEGSLKDLEARQAKQKSVPLHLKIAQAGLNWSKRQFILVSAVMGLGAFLLFLLIEAGLWAALAIGFAAGFGMPLWLLKYLKKRREAKFLNGFPDAVDTIVRGIKAGLPLLDSMRIISADAQEPIRSEFRAIMETQAIGMPVGEACAKLYERIPIAEANFFAIVITIQTRSGGNLSEALGNLTRVLRDRKKMKAKIQAMSMEAKASASIIACLPLAVMLIVYLTSPRYIELLWIHPTGRMMLAGCAVWMLMGVMVMRKMINFDF
jgi:tight adherence protein B